MAHLGHRVMSPAVRTEPVGTREEIRLEDRLQHQFQGRLDHPVGDRGDPQTAQLAARLGDHPLPHRQRTEAAVPQRGPQPVEELLDARPASMDARSGRPPRRSGTLVTPHPIPRHQQERGIGDEIEQVIEPAMRIITSPTVQLGLDLQYPALRLHTGPSSGSSVFTGDTSWYSSLLTADLLAPFAMCALSSRSDYYEASAPPAAISRRRACPPTGWHAGR